jgi:signal transduction histidine kinase
MHLAPSRTNTLLRNIANDGSVRVNRGWPRVTEAWKNRSLATRAAVLVGLAFVLGFSAISWHALKVFEARYLELVGLHQETMLKAQARGLDDRFIMARTVLSGVAGQLRGDVEAMAGFLDNRVYLHLSFNAGLRVYDPSGKVIVRSGSGAFFDVPTDIQRSLLSNTATTGELQVSAPFESTPGSARPALAMSAPLRDEQGQIVGVLLGCLDLLTPHYAADLQKQRVGEGGYLFLTTGQRLLLMHPDPARMFKLAAAPGVNHAYDQAIGQRFEGTRETINSAGERVLVTYARVPSMDWILGATFPMAEARQPFRTALDALLWTVVVALLGLLLLVGAGVRRVMRPIRLLTQHLQAVGEGNAQPFSGRSTGEAKVLADAYNRMIGRLDTSEAARRETLEQLRQLNEELEERVKQRTAELERANAELGALFERHSQVQAELLRSERLAALGRLMSGLAHELNTPLGNALVVATSMRDSAHRLPLRLQEGLLTRSELGQFASVCAESAELVTRNLARASELVRSFKQAAVDQATEQRRRFELADVVRDALASVKYLLNGRPLRLHAELEPGVAMDSFPGAVAQVVVNLVVNALDHAFSHQDQSGDIWVRCAAAGPEGVELSVRDNGRGIDPADLDRIFDPFFTTRLGMGGSGLGLYIVHNAVTGILGGSVNARNLPEGGACLSVWLPRQAPEAHRALGEASQ